jgi:hypothetical protein
MDNTGTKLAYRISLEVLLLKVKPDEPVQHLKVELSMQHAKN